MQNQYEFDISFWKPKQSSITGYNALAYIGTQNLVHGLQKEKHHPLLSMPSAATQLQPHVTIFLRSLLIRKFFFTNQNCFSGDQVLKSLTQHYIEASPRGSVNRVGEEKAKESLLSRQTRSSFMTWLKLAAILRHMSEVNILNHSPEVSIQNDVEPPQMAWTMLTHLKRKQDTDNHRNSKAGRNAFAGNSQEYQDFCP